MKVTNVHWRNSQWHHVATYSIALAQIVLVDPQNHDRWNGFDSVSCRAIWLGLQSPRKYFWPGPPIHCPWSWMFLYACGWCRGFGDFTHNFLLSLEVFIFIKRDFIMLKECWRPCLMSHDSVDRSRSTHTPIYCRTVSCFQPKKKKSKRRREEKRANTHCGVRARPTSARLIQIFVIKKKKTISAKQ